MASRRTLLQFPLALFVTQNSIAVAQRRARVRAPRIDWSVVRFVVSLGEVRDGTGYPHPHLRQVVGDTLTMQLRSLSGLLFFPNGVPAAVAREARRRRVRNVSLITSLQQIETTYPRDREVSVHATVSIVVAEMPGNRLVAGAEGGGGRSDQSRTMTTEQMEVELVDGAVESATDTALQEVIRSFFTA